MNAELIQIGHGGGGRLARELIDREIVERFGAGPLRGLPDAATLPPLSGGPVFTTDSFVVQPFEFPGGNIGDLAVHGTVNDLAVAGSRPRWLSLALILEEGLPMSALRRVLDSIKRAVDDCGVQIATGDTKVVGRGQADGIYINTSGIGEQIPGLLLDPARIEPGDHVLVSGPIGDHGASVLCARKGVNISNGPQSDSAPVHRLVEAIAGLGAAVHFMRDPTRGGLAAVLNEVVEGAGLDIVLEELDLPVSAATHALAEILGLEILHLASEGRVLVVCAADVSDAVVETWKSMDEGRACSQIGVVHNAAGSEGRLMLATGAGGMRLVDSPRGELLPRIC